MCRMLTLPASSWNPDGTKDGTKDRITDRTKDGSKSVVGSENSQPEAGATHDIKLASSQATPPPPPPFTTTIVADTWF